MSLLYEGSSASGEGAGSLEQPPSSTTPNRTTTPDRNENFLGQPSSSEKDIDEEWGNLINQPKRMNRFGKIYLFSVLTNNLLSAAQVSSVPARAKSVDTPPHPSLSHCMSTPNTSKLLTQSYSPSPSTVKNTKHSDDDWGSWDQPKFSSTSSSSQLRSRSTAAATTSSDADWEKW